MLNSLECIHNGLGSKTSHAKALQQWKKAGTCFQKYLGHLISSRYALIQISQKRFFLLAPNRLVITHLTHYWSIADRVLLHKENQHEPCNRRHHGSYVLKLHWITSETLFLWRLWREKDIEHSIIHSMPSLIQGKKSWISVKNKFSSVEINSLQW